MTIDDERSLRTGLHAMTEGQPPLHPTLAERSARRHVAARHRRVAWTAVAVAAVVVGAVPAGRVLRGPKPPERFATSLLSWPDARTPEWSQAALVAREEIERVDHAVVPLDVSRVRWLYADAAPGTDEVVVAWAYCGERECTRVVLAHAARSDATTPSTEEGATAWVFHYGDVRVNEGVEALSTYLRGPEADRGRTNVLVAVVPPDTESVTWWSSERIAGVGGRGALVRHGAAFYGNVGYLSTDANIDVTRRHRPTFGGRVGVPGDRQPATGLPPLPPVVKVPAPYRDAFLSRGPATRTTVGTHADGALSAMYARCDDNDDVQLVFRVGSQDFPLRCDGAVHAVFRDVPVPKGDFVVEPQGDFPYTGLSYAVGFR